ncbi:MAG: DUF4392 domain-containing protein [Castellaniella sp.]|uniref:glutamate cyclase domain-containing protein n=1 Tax=Castellaniella sp. TaxID=1955812 RepID=UPI0012221518|nr:glutamate cyclase domain-containing protein [Castellaniella sp.]TAN25122.1 MAG: DUF4392 domain-containing protein [Castellaniella sp.]
MSNEKIVKIESIVGRTIRRDISRMVDFARGSLEASAKSIAATPNAHVGIVTGFFIRHANPPSPETDGLIGTGFMAANLAAAGVKVTVITDAPCAKAVWAVLDVVPEQVGFEVTSVDAESVRSLRDKLASGDRPLTHLIAIERAAPGSDGKPHREHGWDISNDTAPLDLLFEEDGWKRPWVTIGIGDGGNEIGMGNLPAAIVKSDIPNGELIAARTKADHLVVAGVSNWGGYGLIAALGVLSAGSGRNFIKHFEPELDKEMLRSAVELGQAIDDSRVDRLGTPQMSVDRLPWSEHGELIAQLRDVVLQ